MESTAETAINGAEDGEERFHPISPADFAAARCISHGGNTNKYACLSRTPAKSLDPHMGFSHGESGSHHRPPGKHDAGIRAGLGQIGIQGEGQGQGQGM